MTYKLLVNNRKINESGNSGNSGTITNPPENNLPFEFLGKYEITEKCIVCFACVNVCNYDAIEQSYDYDEMSGELSPIFSLRIIPEKCVKCDECVKQCPIEGAII